ncbi:DNA-3-methyladenine glycosylase [Streptomyces sp. NPDC056069]|uniref:DNA-3-methyladenine glycosylase n=1 Tax=Streptomyces sp. NPDC056069 TaxID=3345702 RepID=UPI0035D6C34D
MCQVPTLGLLAPRGGAEPGVDDRSHCLSPACRRFAEAAGPTTYMPSELPTAMWHCLNLVCGPEGEAGGVLLRAGEALTGTEQARERRLSARYDSELAKGPARLATALDVARSLNGTDACAGPDAPLSLLTGVPPAPDLVRNGPRTGVGGDGAPHPWRFWIDRDPTVSPYRAHTPRKRASSGSA